MPVKYKTLKLGILEKISSTILGSLNLLSLISKTLNSFPNFNNSLTSSKPFVPILLRFIKKFDNFWRFSIPSIFLIKLSLKFKFAKLINLSNPSIFVITFSCKNNEVKLTNESKPSIFSIELPSKYKTFKFLKYSKFSIFLKLLKCKYNNSFISYIL